MILNLPSNFLNLPWFQHWQNGGLGNKPKWSETNPFRTVEGAGQFGGGLNASAGQLYEHFGDKVNRDRQNGLDTTLLDYGFKRAAPPQTMEDFLNRRNPKPADPSNLWANQFPGQSQSFADRVNYLMGERGWGRDYAYRNQTNAIGLGADYDKDGAVSDDEWARYEGGGNKPSAPKLPGNIPGFGGGIFNLPQYAAQQQPMPQQPQVMPAFQQTPGVQPQPPQPGGTPPQVMPAFQQTPGVRPQPQVMPQVPQFDPSIFNMQPQMMVNRPRPMGV